MDFDSLEIGCDLGVTWNLRGGPRRLCEFDGIQRDLEPAGRAGDLLDADGIWHDLARLGTACWADIYTVAILY